MKDDLIRQEALDPFQSFIVQAPAGSGKTQLLTSRILSLLAYRVQKPESILAITFTRKAAQEMKRRVIKALQLGLEPKPDTPHAQALWHLALEVLKKDKTLGWSLLDNPQRLRIMTIDALCSSITHQLPVSSRLGANPKPLDEAWTLYQRAANLTITCLLEQEDEMISTLLLHMNNNQEKVSECIAEMLSTRDQWLPLFFRENYINVDDLRKKLEHNIHRVVLESFRQAMEDTCAVDWNELSLYIAYAASHAETASEQAHLSSWDSLSLEADDIAHWRALATWLCTKDGKLRRTVDMSRGFPAPSSFKKNKEEAAHAKAMKEGMIAWLSTVRDDTLACNAIEELSSLPDPFYTDPQWEVLKALFHVLPEAVLQLELLFAERSQVDFTAISRCALFALGGEDAPTDVDLKFDHTLQHILVDEFQDTSKPQFELIARLVSSWENDGEKTLFLVGDPMQSIYRFRQAEVGGFLQAQRFGIGSVKLKSLFLTSNFRSERPVVDWINQHMPAAFADKDDIYLGAIKYAMFEAQHEASERAGVFAVPAQDASGAQVAITTTLDRLIHDPSIETIAILVRYRTHISDLLPALRDAGIPYQAVEIEKIIYTPCVRQLLQLTEAYLNIANTQAWISVLMSPYIGLSLADMTHLEKNGATYLEAIEHWHRITSLSEEGSAILKRCAPIIMRWMSEKQQLPLPHAIRGVWLALGGPASLPTNDSASDAEPFFTLLQQCQQGGTLDIDYFKIRLESLYSSATKPAKVQVMTIHHAKGLEFDAVIMPGLARQAKSSDKPLLLWDACPLDTDHVYLFAPIHPSQKDTDPLFEFIWKKHKIREKNEHARLLYVAVTRAKKQLYLFSAEGKPSPNSFAALLSLENNATTIHDTTDIASDEVIPLSSPPTKWRRLAPDWVNPVLETIHVMDKPTQRNANPLDLSAILPSRFDSKALGTVLHKEMYLWAENNALIHQPIETHLPRWRAILVECGLPVAQVDWIMRVMKRVQTDAIALDILYPHEDARSEFEIDSYIIDRTYIDKKGVRVIIDYKTSDSHEGFDTHRQQLENYARIMRTVEDRPIRMCLYYPVTGHLEEEFA